MPAIDRIHDAVRNALVKDGWTITDDPFVFKYGGLNLFADLAAERTLAIERAGRRIVVEIKTFGGASPVHDLKVLLGQYHLYRSILEVVAPERRLYLAISSIAYSRLFSRPAFQLIVEQQQLPMIIVDLALEEVLRWIK
jgi:hypothetical protein